MVWVKTGNIRGPQGPPGVEGFVSGVGAPPSAVGVNGTMYLDVSNGWLWGPKSGGAWPAQPLGRVLPIAPTYRQLSSG